MHRGAGRRTAGRMRVGVLTLALLSVLLAATATARPVDYCTIPTKNYTPWGFHTGLPISGATGSYAHGHGTFDPSTGTAAGIMCQVDRVRGGPDREIILSIDHHLLYYSHTAVKWGYPGNLVKLGVRVRKSTDPNCPVGTPGEVTIFASYNGVHQDSVKFSFPPACQDHRHLYHSQSVVTNVEPAS